MASLSLFSLSFLLLTASAASTLVLPIHLERTFPIASFRLNGSTDLRVLGIHYAKVKLGTPPTEFKVIIDTGSDLLWIPCVSCQSCSYNVFNASRSATYLKVDWDKKSNYDILYGDQSRSGGYYASDTFTFDEFHGSMVTSNSSTVVFGCSTQESKYPSDKPFNGVLGLGPCKVSVLSQLASKEMTPRVVSMCLGDYTQPVGFLVFGEAVDPNMVYTPLIPHKPRYNIQLESIVVNGQVLPIDSAVFSAAKKPQGLDGLGTFMDSGTTLIIKSVENVVPYFSLGRLCYLDSSKFVL
uniref:Peptidase A1 domain-containing protein n=1 Tax=Fagus sylvatica TaxID=28930 RepID=A0A2N9HNN3_FAGSY